LLQKFATNSEQWLLPRSRVLLVGLLTANACLALWLNVAQEPIAVVEAPASDIGPEIRLLAEVPIPSTPKLTSRECRSWGPEKDPQAFASLVAELDLTGSFPEVQKQEIMGAPDFLVYVGELGSQDNAKRVSQVLKSQGIDSYIIDRENDYLILSVGVFSKESRANIQLERVSVLGYDVFIEQLERVQTVYNLMAHVNVDSDFYASSTSACMVFAHNP
jgi:cell division septation protein DedD